MTNSYLGRVSQQTIDIVEDFKRDVPVKVGALADALGLRVVLATLPLNISGSIQPDGEEGYIVKVNRFEPKERQRFTIAHEIAHYLLHRDQIKNGIVDSVLYRSKLSSRTEAEANRLAADIVMPSEKIQQSVAKRSMAVSDETAKEMANEFLVSKQAMSIRIGLK